MAKKTRLKAYIARSFTSLARRRVSCMHLHAPANKYTCNGMMSSPHLTGQYSRGFGMVSDSVCRRNTVGTLFGDGGEGFINAQRSNDYTHHSCTCTYSVIHSLPALAAGVCCNPSHLADFRVIRFTPEKLNE